MKLPKRERTAGGAETENVVGRTGRRLACASHVGRQQTAVSRAGSKTLLSRWLSQQHSGAIVGANFGASESVAAVRKHIERDVIRVRPNTHLRIVREIRISE